MLGRVSVLRTVARPSRVLAVDLAVAAAAVLYLLPVPAVATGSAPLGRFAAGGGAGAVALVTTLQYLSIAVGLVGYLGRRRTPLVALVGVCAMVVTHLAIERQDAVWPPELLLFASMYAAGLGAGGTFRARAVTVGCLLAVTVSLSFGPGVAAPVAAASLGLAWLLGHRKRSRRERLEQLTTQLGYAERERDLKAAAAVAAERARISREMHDVLAHGLALMVIQAQSAESNLDRSPAESRQCLRSIITVGRDSLAELRRMLAWEDRRGEADSSPLPGLPDLPAMVDGIRATGLDVSLTLPADGVGEVRQGVGLAAYRIVQEALTNTLKHARDATRAEVRVEVGPRTVEVVITDDGRGPVPDPSTTDGHGLAGMRERAALHGGTLVAGAGPTGGFEVRARIPRDGAA